MAGSLSEVALGAAVASRLSSTPVIRPLPPPYLPAGWRRLEPVARGLILARGLRSVAQGALATDFVLYLRALHWPATGIGLLLTASGLSGGVLGLAVGPVSDRLGRRPFLLFYQAALALCTLAVVLAPRGWVMALVAVVFGYGLGANGAAGPFAPAEQAWLARHVSASARGTVFSLNAAIGFFGMGLGAIAAGLVPLWSHGRSAAAAYLPLFVLTIGIAAVNYLQIARLREDSRGAPAPHEDVPHAASAAPSAGVAPAAQPVVIATMPPGSAPAQTAAPAVAPSRAPLPAVVLGAATPGETLAQQERRLRRHENRALALLMGTNVINALGIGIFAPLLPYWFSVRYGVGAGAIGSVFALTFFLTGIASIVTGVLVERIGLMRAIVAVRVIGVLLLAAMPLMPAFGWAAALYAVRSVLNRGSVGARQAFGVSLVRDQRRGLASSLNNVSWSMPAAAGPAIAGWLMASGSLAVPFYLAAALQLAYAVLFGTVLRRFAPAPGGGGPAAGPQAVPRQAAAL